MEPLELVRLTELMRLSEGVPGISIGLVDGPVLFLHPDLPSESIREIPGGKKGSCSVAQSAACEHGTLVAGILIGRRGSAAPAIAPGCTLLVRPIFSETKSEPFEAGPKAVPEELAAAIIELIRAGARVLNLSVALASPSMQSDASLDSAFDFAASRGVICVAAAGNQASVGSSAITRHPWVLPVGACDRLGRPTAQSNLGRSIARWGLRAPGEGVTSLGVDGRSKAFGGTSAATPFVTGAIALLWSEFPRASAAQIRNAIAQSGRSRGTSIVPPLLNAWSAYQALAQ